ncbi:MAG: DUF1446 domain-containing protein [Acidimicrobiales bacterium]|nr:DUF1446 domain-containing protein [Acidimicrobiales bacterium]
MIKIANCSGFFGDRIEAAREMVEGGQIDFLTGDYLAELTMLILWKSAQKNGGGYARTFLMQMEDVLLSIKEKGIRVVSNAGGLNPAGLAKEIRNLADKLGISLNISHVEGDDILKTLPELMESGYDLSHLDTGVPLKDAGTSAITANAYLGAFPIAAALDEGADIVVTGRVTDAALVIGPAIHKFGWKSDSYDELAGAIVAGHIIECGAQACGGNYAFFKEIPGLEHPGFPIAEIYQDGSSVITKHDGTGGAVTKGTVTAQLLYEISGADYLNPDAIARFDTIKLTDEGKDRVRVSQVKGLPPTESIKVCINLLGGYKNSVTFLLTGLDVNEKAKLAESTFFGALGGKDKFDSVDVRLINRVGPDAQTNEEATSELRVTVKDKDPNKVGRVFSDAATQMALSSYPGFHLPAPPAPGVPYGIYWPALIPKDLVIPVVHMSDDKSFPLTNVASDLPYTPTETHPSNSYPDFGPTKKEPLGLIIGARSGDKGGNANVGLWAKDEESYLWLESFLTVDKLRELLKETGDAKTGLKITRVELRNILALNFVIVGLLGEGVASSVRPDPQAKGLGEYLRGRLVDIPISLIR